MVVKKSETNQCLQNVSPREKTNLQNIVLMHMSGCTCYHCPNTPASYKLVIVSRQRNVSNTKYQFR